MMVSFSGKGMKMKVQKYEIARVIDKLKSIVQKNDQFPALGGILVKDGYLIASNSEITMKVKLEASAGSYFIIPMKAFDLIKNLPDGEIDISATDKNVVMIKIGAIKNKYQSYPPEEFNFDITEDPEADGVELNGKKIMEAISHVIYAAADALVGKVDNDTNGRATIMAAIQGICNAMEAEGKIQYGNVTESTTVTTDGDTCGFDIEVIDLDSAEHIYLNYYFQFSTIVAASGE